MRTWRVGTISMGVALLFLGLYLLFSNLLGWKVATVFSAWWPIILVIVGIEILLYLFFQKQEKATIKFDFLSILFVGVLGTVGIGFTIMHSLGVVEVVSEAVDREQQTLTLPTFSQKMDSTTKRIVLKTSMQPITIESGPNNEVAMFGTYEARVSDEHPLVTETKDYVFTERKGDTLYLQVMELPEGAMGFDSYGVSMDLTVLVPADVKVEVEGKDNTVRLKPRVLLGQWDVERAFEVAVDLASQDHVKISANGVSELVGEGWSSKETDADKNGVFVKGDGNAVISITRSSSVHINSK